jgi:hypothetical protein
LLPVRRRGCRARGCRAVRRVSRFRSRRRRAERRASSSTPGAFPGRRRRSKGAPRRSGNGPSGPCRCPQAAASRSPASACRP